MARGKTKINVDLAEKVAMDRAMKGVRAAGLEAKRIVQVDILSSDPPRTGRKYKRGKNNYHIASAPNESPAPDTGQLRNTMGVSFERDKSVARSVVYSNLEKAADLELGTVKDGGNIAPRPWISRLLTGEFTDRIRAAFYRASRL